MYSVSSFGHSTIYFVRSLRNNSIFVKFSDFSSVANLLIVSVIMIQNQLTLCISPVLKHSPRIMFCMWTSWWCHWLCWEWSEYYVMIGNVCLNTITITACVSILVVTRKSVCNIWKELSLSKCWCMFEEELTFDSFSLLVYRGERLIEFFCSWFCLKFPLG